MHLRTAVQVLSRLRDGEDPRTGKALPANDPAQSPDVVRALYTVLAALPHVGDDDAGERVETPTSPRPRPTRAGKPWTDDEDERLASAFDGGDGVGRLAKTFERSTAAVRLRLVKLGRLTAEDAITGRSRGGREPAAAPVG